MLPVTFQWITGEIWLKCVLWLCRKGWKCETFAEGKTDIQKTDNGLRVTEFPSKTHLKFYIEIQEFMLMCIENEKKTPVIQTQTFSYQCVLVASQSETSEKPNNSSSPVVEAVSGRKDPSIIEHRASTQQVLVGDRDKPKQLLGDDFSVQTDQPRPFSISRHFSTNHAAMSREGIS